MASRSTSSVTGHGSKMQVNGLSVEHPLTSTKPLWLVECKTLTLEVFGSNDASVVQSNMLKIMRLFSKYITICIQNRRRKRGARLLKILKSFIIDFHFKQEENNWKFQKPSYEEMMAILLSIYIELVMHSFGKETMSTHCFRFASFMKMLFGHSPLHIVETLLLLLPTPRKKMWDYLVPLLGCIVSSKFYEGCAESYMKFIVLIKLWRKQCSPDKRTEVRHIGKSVTCSGSVSQWLHRNGLKDLGKLVRDMSMPTTKLLMSRMFLIPDQLKLLRKLKLTKKYKNILYKPLEMKPLKSKSKEDGKTSPESGFFIDSNADKDFENEGSSSFKPRSLNRSRKRSLSPENNIEETMNDDFFHTLNRSTNSPDHNVAEDSEDDKPMSTRKSPAKTMAASRTITPKKAVDGGTLFVIDKTSRNLKVLFENANEEAENKMSDTEEQSDDLNNGETHFQGTNGNQFNHQNSPSLCSPGKTVDDNCFYVRSSDSNESSDVEMVLDKSVVQQSTATVLTRSPIHKVRLSSSTFDLENDASSNQKNSSVKKTPISFTQKIPTKFGDSVSEDVKQKSPHSDVENATVEFSQFRSPKCNSHVQDNKSPTPKKGKNNLLVGSSLRSEKQESTAIPSPAKVNGNTELRSPKKAKENHSDNPSPKHEEDDVFIIPTPVKRAEPKQDGATEKQTPRKCFLAFTNKTEVSLNTDDDAEPTTTFGRTLRKRMGSSSSCHQADVGVTPKKNVATAAIVHGEQNNGIRLTRSKTTEASNSDLNSPRKKRRSPGSSSSSCTDQHCSSKHGSRILEPHLARVSGKMTPTRKPELDLVKNTHDHDQKNYAETLPDSFDVEATSKKPTSSQRKELISHRSFQNRGDSKFAFSEDNPIGSQSIQELQPSNADYESEGVIQLTPRMKRLLPVLSDSDDSCEVILNSSSLSVSSSEIDDYSSDSSSSDLDSEPDASVFASLNEETGSGNSTSQTANTQYSPNMKSVGNKQVNDQLPHLSLEPDQTADTFDGKEDDIVIYNKLKKKNLKLSEILKLVNVALEERESNSLDLEKSLAAFVKSDCQLFSGDGWVRLNDDAKVVEKSLEDGAKDVSNVLECCSGYENESVAVVQHTDKTSNTSPDHGNEISSPIIKLLPPVSRDTVQKVLASASGPADSQVLEVSEDLHSIFSTDLSLDSSSKVEKWQADNWSFQKPEHTTTNSNFSSSFVSVNNAELSKLNKSNISSQWNLDVDNVKRTLFGADRQSNASTSLYVDDEDDVDFVLKLDESDEVCIKSDLKLKESDIHLPNSAVQSPVVHMSPTVLLERLPLCYLDALEKQKTIGCTRGETNMKVNGLSIEKVSVGCVTQPILSTNLEIPLLSEIDAGKFNSCTTPIEMKELPSRDVTACSSTTASLANNVKTFFTKRESVNFEEPLAQSTPFYKNPSVVLKRIKPPDHPCKEVVSYEEWKLQNQSGCTGMKGDVDSDLLTSDSKTGEKSTNNDHARSADKITVKKSIPRANSSQNVSLKSSARNRKSNHSVKFKNRRSSDKIRRTKERNRKKNLKFLLAKDETVQNDKVDLVLPSKAVLERSKDKKSSSETEMNSKRVSHVSNSTTKTPSLDASSNYSMEWNSLSSEKETNEVEKHQSGNKKSAPKKLKHSGGSSHCPNVLYKESETNEMGKHLLGSVNVLASKTLRHSNFSVNGSNFCTQSEIEEKDNQSGFLNEFTPKQLRPRIASNQSITLNSLSSKQEVDRKTKHRSYTARQSHTANKTTSKKLQHATPSNRCVDWDSSSKTEAHPREDHLPIYSAALNCCVVLDANMNALSSSTGADPRANRQSNSATTSSARKLRHSTASNHSVDLDASNSITEEYSASKNYSKKLRHSIITYHGMDSNASSSEIEVEPRITRQSLTKINSLPRKLRHSTASNRSVVALSSDTALSPRERRRSVFADKISSVNLRRKSVANTSSMSTKRKSRVFLGHSPQPVENLDSDTIHKCSTSSPASKAGSLRDNLKDKTTSGSAINVSWGLPLKNVSIVLEKIDVEETVSIRKQKAKTTQKRKKRRRHY